MVQQMEDFIEEILGEEIVDETDVYVDNTSLRQDSRSADERSHHARGSYALASEGMCTNFQSISTRLSSSSSPEDSTDSPTTLGVGSPVLEQARDDSPALNSRRYDGGALIATLAQGQDKPAAASWLFA